MLHRPRGDVRGATHTRKNVLATVAIDAHDEAGLASLVESQLTLSLSRILG